ncbi:MAG: Zn-ribbon domain-containing OB-fold protein, partial [Chloroflexi bacterium]|nr:Zn-ribbon domain-containing OB-fold protein [Chloroflexota bacterium]
MTAAAEKKQVPVMEGIFTWPSADPRLIGSRCRKCGTVFFPASFRCMDPACRGEEVEKVELSKKGKLWSYTINYYPLPPPYKAPKDFKPFGVGEVEFPEGIRVAGVIVDCDPEKDLKIGMDMELVFDKYYDDEQGNEV